MATRESIPFLENVLSLQTASESSSIFNITLTFAQSLDAKIAAKDGRQLILSGRESMLMTHWMRSMHDAILVGIGTALNDDPQLNTRLLPQGKETIRSPQPIILDSNLRFRIDSKLLKNFREGKGRRPLIVSRKRAPEHDDHDYEARRRKLEELGATVLEIHGRNDGLLSLPALVDELHGLGIRSLMVEGGAKVISSFLNSGLVDTLVVTVAPTMVGHEGTGYIVGGDGPTPRLDYLRSLAVGQDTVLAWKVQKS